MIKCALGGYLKTSQVLPIKPDALHTPSISSQSQFSSCLTHERQRIPKHLKMPWLKSVSRQREMMRRRGGEDEEEEEEEEEEGEEDDDNDNNELAARLKLIRLMLLKV